MSSAGQPNLKTRALGTLIKGVMGIIGASCSITVFKGRQAFEALASNEHPVILCHWHNRIFYFSYLARWMLLKNGFKLTMMSSLSKDGEIGAYIGNKSGATVVRGSSSRSGSSGLRALYRSTVKQGNSIILLPDGSKGPVYKAKMGVVVIAQLTGAPIVPMSYSVDRYWTIKSWDRMIIPKPFANVVIEVGEPLFVDRDARDEEMEKERVRVETELNRLTESTDAVSMNMTN